MSLPSSAERSELISLLESVTRAVEELLLTGLAAASDATRETLAVSFRAASGMRLLRLGSTLRVAVEEIGRYAGNDPLFSRKRFSFFVNRAWVLCRGMHHALQQEDEALWGQLSGAASGRLVDELEVVTMGVMRRVVPNAFVAFEFRLRTLGSRAGMDDGSPLVWSSVYPLRQEAEVPAEAYLHLPTSQGFKAAQLLPGRVARVKQARLSEDGRLTLGEGSTVESVQEPFQDWERFLHWDPQTALGRLKEHQPGPLDLEVDLQEEVVLREWQVGEPEALDRERQLRYPIRTPDGEFHALVGTDEGAAPLRQALKSRSKRAQQAPLFGVLHYEMCRFMVQPLTVFKKDGPESLMLSKENYDPAALLKALKFT